MTERRISKDDAARRAIKVWMREVMAQKDWSANEWARRAGTSPTNITRFLAPTSEIVPSSSTVAKLSRAAGSTPKIGYGSVDINVSLAANVPLLSLEIVSGFNQNSFWEFAMTPAAGAQSIAVDGPLDGPAFVTDVPSHAMLARGITPGDRILVEKISPKELAPGHIVLFRHEGRAMIGEWQGSMIVFYPAVPAPEYQPVRSSMVEVYGRVRRLIREL